MRTWLTNHICDEIIEERKRQFQKWGRQKLSPSAFFIILAEEFGEVAREILDNSQCEHLPRNYRTELIQVAAVAVQMIEEYDRNLGVWKERCR